VLVDFDSDWFKNYSKALLSNDSRMARTYVRHAVQSINERLKKDGVISAGEHEALVAAMRQLVLIDGRELRKAS
jgi:hypothetical protein